jgi:hypothetical protein
MSKMILAPAVKGRPGRDPADTLVQADIPVPDAHVWPEDDETLLRFVQHSVAAVMTETIKEPGKIG